MEKIVDRRALTIELRREGANLVRSYHVPVFGRIDGEVPEAQPLAGIGRAFRVGSGVGLSGLNDVLARGVSAELDLHLGGANLDSAGELLFEVLFGPDESRWQHVLRFAASIPEEVPNPIRVRLRVRVLTDMPELLGLPWRVVQWRGHFLSDWDWTFEVSGHLKPAARIDYRSPGRVLVIAPPEPFSLAGPKPPPIEVDRHLEDLCAVLDNISPGFAVSDGLSIVRSRGELERLLRGFTPNLVYFYGHGDAAGSSPQIHLGSAPEDAMLVRDFADLLREQPPQVVFLNGCWTGKGSWNAAGHQLLPLVPVVVANATAANAEVARRYALDWLEDWLGHGEDPVKAAHARPRDTRRLSEWPPSVVYADYDLFATSRPARTRIHVRSPEHWLDRDKQRSLALKYITDLVRHAGQRVEAVILYAEPGNAIEQVAQQIIDYIEREAGDRIHVHVLRVPFPDARGSDLGPEQFDHSLKACLQIDPRTQVARVERALAAKAPLPKGDAARVLWLDWGVLRGQASFANEVLAWLDFCRDYLASTPFASYKVVASLAIEAEGEAFKALSKNLPDLRSDPELWTDRFRCAALEPLSGASPADLLSFLEAHGCDPGDVRPLAAAIFEKTRGQYVETRELLREGLRLGWRVLLNRLGAPKKQRPRQF